jgi:hypothetical protein
LQVLGALDEHFHTRSCFIMAVLKLGIVLSRREYIAWARQSYEDAKTWGTEFGWFPEGLGHRHGEICCTTDMIEIALLLGRHVDRAYYADAERFGRNHLLESQFLSLKQLSAALTALPPGNGRPPYDGRFSMSDRVAERQVGAFGSRPTLNDAFHLDACMLMQCCNAAGTRAIHDLWRYAVEAVPAGNSGLPEWRVHLRFSVQHPGLRVISHEPATGLLALTPDVSCRLSVRLPVGSSQAVAICTRPSGGSPQVRTLSLEATNGYVEFEAGAGERVELYYPLTERVAWYEVGRPGRTAQCKGRWRGETLVAVDPPGPYFPLYQDRASVGPVEPAAPAGPLMESI